jgi:ribonuclease-3
MKDFSEFERKIGITFNNKALLRVAFTHRSFLNENRSAGTQHNERLEFLGDAVVELAVTDYLYKKFPDRDEGELTSFRAALVNAVTLSDLASKLSMNDYLLLSKGESKDVGRARQFILANTFESFVGALFLDRGMEACVSFLEAYLFPLTDGIVEGRLWQDAKSFFQEKSQDEMSVTPSYKLVRENGPDHDKQFTIGVYIGNELVAEGDGKSKQEAEQAAARKALEKKGWS